MAGGARSGPGGRLFPKFHIDEIKKQEGRDLTRFDLDIDLPDHFLPEYPPPMYLTTRLDLGDVSQGKVVTVDNYFELFKDVLNPNAVDDRHAHRNRDRQNVGSFVHPNPQAGHFLSPAAGPWVQWGRPLIRPPCRTTAPELPWT